MTKKRKNPYGLLPFAIPLIAGSKIITGAIVGGALVGGAFGTASVWNSAAAIAEIKNPYKVAEALEQAYAQIEDQTFDISLVNVVPTYVLQPPTNEKQAIIQAAWRLMQGSVLVGLPQGNSLLKLSKELYSQSVWASNTEVPPNSQKIQQPLNQAITTLNGYYAQTSSLIGALQRNTNTQAIQEQQNFEAENLSTTKNFGDTVAKTWQEITAFPQIALGLLTGKKPPFMDDKKWQKIQIIGYTALALGGTAYITTQLKPLIEVYAKKRMKQLDEEDDE